MIIYNDISEFIKLKPSRFNFLQELKFTRDINTNGCSTYSAEIILCQLVNYSIKKIFVHCEGVVDIKLGDIEGMYGMLLEIEDVKSKQLENICFKLTEQENESFSFLCNTFCIEFREG